jgi:hypothetical protein
LSVSSSHYFEEICEIENSLKEIPAKNSKFGMEIVANNLSSLLEIEKIINPIERALPAYNSDVLMHQKLKELEENISDLVKSSSSTLQSIESFVGYSEISEKLDFRLLKSAEIITETYTTTYSSIQKYLKSLTDIEKAKSLIVERSPIRQDLLTINKNLMTHFLNSQSHKEAACNKLRRISRETTEVNTFLHEILKHTDISEKSAQELVSILHEKNLQFIQMSEEQDRVVSEITEKFNLIEKIVDETEIKFDEIVSSEFKDFYKIMPVNDLVLKKFLDQAKEEFDGFLDEINKDLLQRLENFQKKIETAASFEKIKFQLRESQNREALKIKTELNERINELSGKASLVDREKATLENSISGLRMQLEKTSEIAEKMIMGNKEKEMEIINLKNKIAAVNEYSDQINEEKNQAKDEIDDLRRELKECKKNLRNKENELREALKTEEVDS